jgi:hexosaminidase
MKYRMLFFAVLFLTVQASAQTIQLIPQPAKVEMGTGSFKLSSTISIGHSQPEARAVAESLAVRLSAATGFRLKIQKTGAIQLTLLPSQNALLGDEGYILEVRKGGVKIQANRPAGLFYGTQTLLQLFPREIESRSAVKASWIAPAVKITDYPRFPWRGLMLDVSRHFFSKDDVKRAIDRMARYKYNIFHWHLTDDNGWRVEIKSLPKLTEIGACRVSRQGKFGSHEAPKPGEPATDCGFYTQDDIREIVRYAAERFITIVPEVDVPGHSMAAIASYPELSCTKDPATRVSPGHSFSEWYSDGKFKMLVDNTLNPSDEKVYEFMDKVFTEIAALFPGKYIHVGGDECYRGYWENDAGCKALMAKEGMKNSVELHGYFMRRMEQILKSKGKKLIGWDEIVEGGLAAEAAVMSWRGMKGGIEAARSGHSVVMTPAEYTYLDLPQGEDLVEPDILTWSRSPLRNCYRFEPVPEGVDSKYILGGQGNLWTEKIPTYRHAEYMTWPRGWALAETYWSPKEVRNWDSFLHRMEAHMERADVADSNYARSTYDAILQPKMEDGRLMISMTTEIPGLDIFYTLDETLPDRFTKQYVQPIEVPAGNRVTLKVITCRSGKPVGKLISISREELLRRTKR